DHVTGPNLFDRTSQTLCPTATSCDDQGLTQWMRVPRRSSAGLKCDAGTSYACRSVCLEQWINAHRARKPIGWTFAGGLRANSFDFHIFKPPMLCSWILYPGSQRIACSTPCHLLQLF